jgi:hypothetical protein
MRPAHGGALIVGKGTKAVYGHREIIEDEHSSGDYALETHRNAPETSSEIRTLRVTNEPRRLQAKLTMLRAANVNIPIM